MRSYLKIFNQVNHVNLRHLRTIELTAMGVRAEAPKEELWVKVRFKTPTAQAASAHPALAHLWKSLLCYKSFFYLSNR